MSDNESEDNGIQPSLAVTIQNDLPFEIKPDSKFWGKLAANLSTGPQGFSCIKEALKGVYSLALKSAVDSNDKVGVHLHPQNTLAVPLEELCKVFAAVNATNGNQPPLPEDLALALSTAVEILQGVFLDRVTKAIDNLNDHSTKLGKAITSLQEQVTMLQAQVPTPLTRQGSQTQRVRAGPNKPYKCYSHGVVLTWEDVLLALTHPLINSDFCSDVTNVQLRVPLPYSFAAMINLVTALTRFHPEMSIELNQTVADLTNRFGYSDSTVINDYAAICPHKKNRLKLTNFQVAFDENGTPTFLNVKRDVLMIVKLRHMQGKNLSYAYVLYIPILRCFVYTSEWSTHGFKAKSNRAKDSDGNPIPVHVWWCAPANLESFESIATALVKRVFAMPNPSGNLRFVNIAFYKAKTDTPKKSMPPPPVPFHHRPVGR